MTDINANKQIVVSFIDALFSKGDLTAVDQYLDPGFVDHDPPLPGASAGREGMRQAAAVFRAAFPDWRSDVEQLVAEGDLVVEVFTARYAPWRAHGRGADRTGGRAAGREHFPTRRWPDRGAVGSAG